MIFRFKWALLGALLCSAFTLLWIRDRANAARDKAYAEVVASKIIPAAFRALTAGSPPARLIGSAARFQDAVSFNGRVYLCGPGGLYGYDAGGSLLESYTAGRELPPGPATALATDGTRLFVAVTGSGLIAFDGKRFQQLVPDNPRQRTFTSLLALNTGRLLLGTLGSGILVWDGKALTTLLPALRHESVTTLAGADADIWIGTLANGVYRLHGGKLDHFLTELPDAHVLSAATFGLSAFIGTPLGVVEFQQGKKFQTLAEGYFAKSIEADGETLAVGTEDEGILTISLRATLPRGDSAASFQPNAPVDRIVRIHSQRYALAGNLFQATGRAGSWQPVLKPAREKLSDSNIASLAVARDGKIWVGYFDRGIDIADARFEKVQHFEDDHLFCINRIVEEPNTGRTAVATANGVVLFDASLHVRQVIGKRDGLLADHITDILFRPEGIVMATPAGLSFAGADGVHSLNVFHGLVNNHVYSLASIGNQIAAGTLGGLSLLQNDLVQANYTVSNSGLKHNWISALARMGDDWFAGTYGAGVMRLDASRQWHSFPDLKAGFEVNPNAMAVSGNNLYVGSLGKGLWIFRRSSGRWNNVVTGLPSLNVTALAVANGSVYAGTDNGLVQFRESDLP